MKRILFWTLAAAMAAPALASATPGATTRAAGQHLYESACIACHGTGAAGAPEVGDKTAWAPFVAGGLERMVSMAMRGNGAMPARGGTQADEANIRAAVEYMMGMSR